MANAETRKCENLRESMQLISSSYLQSIMQLRMDIIGPVLSKRYDGQQKLDTCDKQVW